MAGVDPWCFTGFYGHPKIGQLHISWDYLRSLAQPTFARWVVMGDFNEILSLNEKSGGPLKNSIQMQPFHDPISDCNLDNLGAVGGPFTCSQERGVAWADLWSRGYARSRRRDLDAAVAWWLSSGSTTTFNGGTGLLDRSRDLGLEWFWRRHGDEGYSGFDWYGGLGQRMHGLMVRHTVMGLVLGVEELIEGRGL
ncbi:hypothetical protein M0R45_030584 [Rubus argutus]|uniref:Uncharacterized protein n=1 Tax=Rubus argutus TaxID=59490 RepID=A0AAW1WBZ0_RUBAR